MKLHNFSACVGGVVALVVAVPGRAQEGGRRPPIVVRYEAPPACPDAEAFAAKVRSELAGRRWDASRPLQVHVVISEVEHGYSAMIASNPEGEESLERTVSAPSCGEATEIAAEIVTLAQGDAPDVVVSPPPAAAPVAPSHHDEAPPSRPAAPAPPVEAPSNADRPLLYSFTLGYGAFTAGPATPVARGAGEVTTFNPAQGVRIGFGITHAVGWWKHSLHLSAAYYRQSTSTVGAASPSSALVATDSTTAVPGIGTPGTTRVSLDDRDVLLATLDACPVQLEYAFVSLIPCGTFSLMQSRGQSGENPGLETGFGGSARLRGSWGWLFAELMGTVVAVSSSYERPSEPVRSFYSLSLGVQFQ